MLHSPHPRCGPVARLRRLSLARSMLLVWVLGVVVSWANACVLEAGRDGGAPAHAAAALLTVPTHDHSSEPPHEAHDAAWQVCWGFCDNGSHAIAKTASPTPDGALALVIDVLSSSAGWSWPGPAASTRSMGPRSSTPVAPLQPVAIRFLRLNL